MNKRYSELIALNTFIERFQYLQLNGCVCDPTFGSNRYLNQSFYTSPEWRETRRRVIIRDNGCDLGFPGHDIHGRILVHHINPITVDDIVKVSPALFDLENLISTSEETHQAIHYGDESLLKRIEPIVRMPNDTCPWKH